MQLGVGLILFHYVMIVLGVLCPSSKWTAKLDC